MNGPQADAALSPRGLHAGPSSGPGFGVGDAAILAGLVVLVTLVLWPILTAPADRAPGLPGHDGRTQWYPWRVFGFRSVRQGTLPLWNPYVLCGVPFVGNSQSALFYPPNLLFAVVRVGVAARWSVWLHLVLSAVFTYALGRALGLGRPGSAVAAMAFTFCGAQVLRVPAGHWGVSCAIPWLVLAVLCAERILGGAAAMGVVAGAIAVCLQILSGMPQYVFVTAIAVGAFVLARCYGDGLDWGKRLRRWTGVGGMFALGACAAGVQLLPGLEAALHGARSLPMRPEWAEQFSLGPECLLTMLVPGFFGGTSSAPYWGRFLYWEMNAYVGVAALGLSVAGIVYGRRRLAVGLGVLGGVMLLLALGRHTPLWRLFSRAVPLAGGFRGPAKFLLPFSLAVALLAGVGAEAMTSGRVTRLRRAVPAAAFMFVVLGLVLCRGWVVPWLQGLVMGSGECLYAAGSVRPSEAAVLRGGLLALGLLGGLLLAGTFLASRPGWCTGLLVGLVAADALLFGRAFIGRGATFPARGTDWPRAGAEVLRLLGNGRRALVLGSPAMNDAMLEGVPTVEGIEPNPPARFHLFFRLGQGLPADVAPSLYQVVRRGRVCARTATGRVLVRLAEAARIPEARVVWTDGTWRLWELDSSLPRALVVHERVLAGSASEALRMALEADLRRVVVLEESGEPPEGGRPAASSAARILVEGPNWVRVSVQLERPGWLVLLDNWFPGWTAEVDGSPAPVLRADFCFRAVPLPAGLHLVTFRYRPASVRIGLALSMLGLLLCGVVTLRWWMWRRAA